MHPDTQPAFEREVAEMLRFFHSLSVLLWYDTASLRDLVVLDPRWVIDASTSFVRDLLSLITQIATCACANSTRAPSRSCRRRGLH